MSELHGIWSETEDLAVLMINKRILKAKVNGIELEMHPSAFPQLIQEDVKAEPIYGKTCHCGCPEDGHDARTGLCYNGAHSEAMCNPPAGDLATIPTK